MKFFFVCLFSILIQLKSISQEFLSAKEKNKFKPTLFHNYSDTIDTNQGFFNLIETLNLGDKTNLPITSQLIFKGKVNILHQTSDYRTLSIESEETPGLRLIISHTSEDKYYGIIGCVKHKDVLVLELNQKNEKYVWIKKEIADKIPD